MDDSPGIGWKHGMSYQYFDILLSVLQMFKKDHKRARKAKVSRKSINKNHLSMFYVDHDINWPIHQCVKSWWECVDRALSVNHRLSSVCAIRVQISLSQRIHQNISSKSLTQAPKHLSVVIIQNITLLL